jgi:hypothetical protein
MSARKGDLGARVALASVTVSGCLRDYLGVDDQGARVLASLHNLLARAERELGGDETTRLDDGERDGVHLHFFLLRGALFPGPVNRKKENGRGR